MDFASFKEKASQFTKKAGEKIDSSLNWVAQKYAGSKYIVSDEEELKKRIEKTKNTINEYGKTSIKRLVVIYAEKDSEYYKKLLTYIAPIMYTKAFVQNIPFAITSLDRKKLKKFDVTDSPAILIFENTKHVKTLIWEEAIEKVVKSTDFDINKLIHNQ